MSPVTNISDDASLSQKAEQPELTGFRVALHNFEGPFDLLLHLIGKKKLDITEVALAEVTDEFIAYTRALGETADLDETTQFVLVAATLLDIKAARLIPHGESDSEEELEALRERELLFVRLLQYRAYQKVAALFRKWEAEADKIYPREVSMEEPFVDVLPPLRLDIELADFATLAASVFRPHKDETVDTGHLHQVEVSVPHEAGFLLDTLSLAGKGTWMTFSTLTRDCTVTMEIVGRFLALLELFKAHAVDVDQPMPLEELNVAWTGKTVDPTVVAAANWD
ncbi:segregation and condensation protein A [Corynebacterium glucuronolyticum]